MICTCIGFGLGYWAVFLTATAEQFGTNIRVTVASTIPNFVRATPIILGSAVLATKGAIGYLPSLQVVGTTTFAVSLCAIWLMKETYGVDLNFVELAEGTRALAPRGSEAIGHELEADELPRAEGWS